MTTVRVIPVRSVKACPQQRLSPQHYRLDGSCECGPRIGQDRLGRAFVEHDLFWWHSAILHELERIADCDGPHRGRAAYAVPGIAGNLRIGAIHTDVDRYVDQLLAAGLIREVDPLWPTTVPPMRFIEIVPDIALEA